MGHPLQPGFPAAPSSSAVFPLFPRRAAFPPARRHRLIGKALKGTICVSHSESHKRKTNKAIRKVLFNGSRQTYWKQETDCFILKSLLQIPLHLGAKDIYSSSIAVREKRFERDFATFERSCGFFWAPSSSLSIFKRFSSAGYSGNSGLPGQSFSKNENNCPCHGSRYLLAWQILIFLANKMHLS